MKTIDRFIEFIVRNLVVVICFTTFTFVFFAVFAPILAHKGYTTPARYIYRFFSLISHQRPWRSIHLYDYQMAWDVRMTFIFSAYFFISVFHFFYKFRAISQKTFLLFVVPIALDGGVQLIAEYLFYFTKMPLLYESTNVRRMITGTLFGTGVGIFTIPQLVYASNKRKGTGNPLFAILVGVFLCFILFFCLNLVS